MPSGRIDQTIYIGPFQNIEAMNTPTLYKPGELGSQVQIGTKAYQLIQVDSGATAAVSAAGHAPQAGETAFWRDKSKYIVTNNRNDAGVPAAGGGGGATNSRNFVAGVFVSVSGGAGGTASVTPGNYGVIQQRGQSNTGILTSATTASGAGLFMVSSSSATLADTSATAVGSSPVGSVVGISTGATAASYTPATIGGYDLVDTP